MICPSWADWRHGPPWLLEVLAAAEQEARERGQARVAPVHLAAALTRSPAARAVLDELGVDPRRWRDRIIYTLGVNNGIHFQLEGEAIRRLPHQGELVVEDSSLRVLELAAHEAMASSAELAPAHLIVAFVDRQRGDIATGTAKAEGITLAAARRSAGIPHERRVIAEGNPPSLRRPQRNGPLVLLGGGDTSPQVFRYAIELASARRGASHRPVNVACVFASGPGRPQQNRDTRLAQFRLRNDVNAEDCHLDNRNDAADPEVLTALAQADIIFMDGGKPELLYDTIAGSPAMAALIEASDNGAVMMGSSAGSVIWGIGCMSDWTSGDQREPFPLLNWLSGVAVLAHYVPEDETALRRLMLDVGAQAGLGVPHGGAVAVQAGWESWLSIAPGVGHCCAIRQPDGPAQELEPLRPHLPGSS
ncbi:MAG: Type 1 glutamine amidotransferase-like domain-containing protein [Actinomycetota bacterium]|nr:Type 1 glutamine amidotransferase-like domain-containing protein [Actinomycetota bacterium]